MLFVFELVIIIRQLFCPLSFLFIFMQFKSVYVLLVASFSVFEYRHRNQNFTSAFGNQKYLVIFRLSHVNNLLCIRNNMMTSGVCRHTYYGQ